MVFFKLTSFIS